MLTFRPATSIGLTTRIGIIHRTTAPSGNNRETKITMALNTFDPIRSQFIDCTNTPSQHLEATLAAVQALEPTLHGFVSFCRDARDAADASTRRYKAGQPRSLLDGCPVGIKDIIETADAPTQMNSPLFAGWHSERDAPCVHALRKAGAIIVGKTHTTEFAIGRSAPTTNPHDTSRTPGGSSSGSAALVGGGLLPIALATQTAGSILRPASYCGAYGFKPSHGLLPVAGIHPLSRSLDTLGAIGASLDDVWQAVYHMWRWTGSDDWRLNPLVGSTPSAGLRHRRLAWLRTDAWTALDSATENAFALAVSKLRAGGIEVLDASTDERVGRIERGLENVAALNTDIVRAEIRYPMTTYYERSPGELGERIRAMVESGASIDPEGRRRLLQRQHELRDAVQTLEPAFDGFISLASTGPAPVGLEYTGDRTFLSPWSVVGGPAFSLPVLESQSLPVGLQLMGFHGADVALAMVAAWVDEQLVD